MKGLSSMQKKHVTPPLKNPVLIKIFIILVNDTNLIIFHCVIVMSSTEKKMSSSSILNDEDSGIQMSTEMSKNRIKIPVEERKSYRLSREKGE